MKNYETFEEIMNKYHLSDEAEEVLRKIYHSASSENEKLKDAIPGIILISDTGVGVTNFCKAYDEILKMNHVYRLRGRETFLELYFPKYASEIDYSRFFQSPRIVASTKNKFYGTFVISYEDWEGMELLRDKWFKKLMQFEEENQSNIHFIHHIIPGFRAKEELIAELKQHMNYLVVNLDYPSVKKSYSYIDQNLKDAGVNISSDAKQKLLEWLDKKENEKRDYHTLNQVVKKLQFEVSQTKAEKDNWVVSKQMVQKMEQEIATGKRECDTIGKFGFAK